MLVTRNKRFIQAVCSALYRDQVELFRRVLDVVLGTMYL